MGESLGESVAVGASLAVVNHPLDSARQKLARATEHLESLDREILGFRETNPYTTSREYDPATGKHSFKLIDIPEVPQLRWGSILGDVAHNTRSALDHVTWQLAGSHADRATAFPILTDRTRWPEQRRKALHHIRPNAQALIEQLQPFQSQGPFLHVLYLVNRLDIEDKHRSIPLLIVNLNEPAIQITFPPNTRCEWTVEGLAGAVEKGTVIAEVSTVPPNPEMHVDGEFPYDIAFAGGLFETNQLMFVRETSLLILRAVEEIVRAFEPFFPN